jgi:hypothetical protein
MRHVSYHELNDGVSIANHEFEIVILLTHMSVRRRIGCSLINLPLHT